MILLTLGSLNSWHHLRRAVHEALTKRAIQNYQPMQTKEATILVSLLLRHSDNHKQDGHFKRLAASTIMSILYGYPTILSDHDHTIEEIKKFNDCFVQTLTMGSYYVDIFPWMKYIPAMYWLFFQLLTVSADWLPKLALQNGSTTGYKHLQRPPRCLLVFSIVLKLTLYVLIFSTSSGARLIENKEQWERPTKFLCIIDTEFWSIFSQQP